LAAPINRAALITSIDRNSKSLKTVIARFDVSLATEKGKKFSLNGSYVGEATGNFRMRLMGPLGITAADIACIDGRVAVVLPTKNQLMEGDIGQALTAGNSELPLLLAACNARDLFIPTAWTSEAVERRGKNQEDKLVVSVMGTASEGAEELSCLRRYTIAPDSRAICLQELMADGRRFGCIEYLGHVQLHHWPEGMMKMGPGLDGKLEFPKAIRISHASKMTLELSMTHVVLNTHLPNDCFDLKKPDNFKHRELVDAIRSGEKFIP